MDMPVTKHQGWDAPSLAQLIEAGPPEVTIDESPDPLEGFVFPKRRRRNPLPKLGIVLLLATAGVSAYFAVHKKGVPIAAVRPKDCLELPSDLSGKELTRFTRVGCNSAHNAEVFASKVFPTDAPFPGEEMLAADAAKSCESSVPAEIRTHPDAPTWSIRFFAPISKSTYHQGETATLLCVVSFPRDITA